MAIYDDKTLNIIESNGYYILPTFVAQSNATFKASYIVAANVNCSGKITALFNLVVFGNLKADELEVKGRFVCTGKCEVSGSIFVQNDIWAEDITASEIESHDKIVAHTIETGTIRATGSIIVGKILAIEESAKSDLNILCGETIYGAGKVTANSIITVEPLDLDNEEESVNVATACLSCNGSNPNSPIVNTKYPRTETTQYADANDYKHYIELLKSLYPDETVNIKLVEWQCSLSEIESVIKNGINKCRDLKLFILLTEIRYSVHFNKWGKIMEWYDLFGKHFKCLTSGEDPNPRLVSARRLVRGDRVSHDQHGKGIVVGISDKGDRASIVFDDDEMPKVFAIPLALTHFTIYESRSSKPGLNYSDSKTSIHCRITTYGEWLKALDILRRHKKTFDKDIYEIAFDLIASNLGLKTKFITDRLEEKGWLLDD